METVQKRLLTVPCDQCSKENFLTVPVLSPLNFSNPEKATMLFQYYCKHCGKAQAVRTAFTLDENLEVKIELKFRVQPSSLFLPKAPERGITVKPRQKKQ